MPVAHRSWGGLSATSEAALAPESADAAAVPDGPWLARGMGRSYGDSCLTSVGAVIDTTRMNRVIAFDRERGVIRVEAGLMLGDLIRHLAGSGWFPPVLPGTQFVTVGGAIANDIHGKNHHGNGTFGRHVPAFTLLRSDGTRRRCAPDENAGLFAATIGGMGLTGLILDADIQLMRVGAHDVVQEATPLANLSDFFRLAPEAEMRSEYVVAWIDSLASGAKLGRGVLITGRHAGGGADAPLPARARLSVPFTPPIGLVSRPGLKAFNALYRWRTLARRGPNRIAAGNFFFPLDAVGHWSRLYGPRGLRQHQSVVPVADAERVVANLLETAAAAGHGSLLTVLKLYGQMQMSGQMSFPMPGVTLTLDFANSGAATDRLLARLDDLTLAAGGRVNPYKDARMSRAVFEASFPEHGRFRPFIDPQATSDFARRVGLVAG
jgi:FAD/FMN-containing dehydrogenase